MAGPAEKSYDVTTTLRFVTSNPENVTLMLAGEQVTADQLTDAGGGVYTYTVDFAAYLEQWKAANLPAETEPVDTAGAGGGRLGARGGATAALWRGAGGPCGPSRPSFVGARRAAARLAPGGCAGPHSVLFPRSSGPCFCDAAGWGILNGCEIARAARRACPGKKGRPMAKESSFDVVSTVDMQEVDNAFQQAKKEIAQRYDLKDSGAEVALDKAGQTITVSAPSDFVARQVIDVVGSKLVRRGIDLAAVKWGDAQPAAGRACASRRAS